MLLKKARIEYVGKKAKRRKQLADFEDFLCNYDINDSLNSGSVYFNLSCRPITKEVEDDMELLSDLVTWGERYLNNFESGVYDCARCSNQLYSSQDKYRGPCVWPSFRKPLSSTDSISTEIVEN